YIEKDAALERRFQKIYVTEPSVEDTIAILRGLRPLTTALRLYLIGIPSSHMLSQIRYFV
ncbi:MAG: hypothetical protein ACTS74_03825, partial [Arsenophonus sp. ET-YP4-MAG3]